MSFLWRSVVGKLWMTIILLVTVVLVILAILLVQFFDHFYFEQQNEELKHLAFKIADIFETYEHHSEARYITKELVEVSQTTLVVIGPDQHEFWKVSADKQLPIIDVEILFNDSDLQQVFFGRTIDKRGHFPVYIDGRMVELDVLIVAAPIMIEGTPHGAVFLYQTLDVINETIEVTKRIILYSAGIAIFLTTIFAFFLSTRITYPLRQMKVAADNIAKGDFNSRVSIRSNDEIGDLALTFNHMAKQLNDSIQALSHEKELLSSILRSMVDGVITLDRKGEVILLNPPAEKMLKTWRYEENMEDEPHKLPRLLLDVFDQVVQTEGEHVRTVSAQGRFWTIVMAPLYNRETLRGAVAVVRDMTEEKRLDKLRKDFVANVSHELRTPLAMLQGYSEALVDDVVGSAEERKELAKIIHEESMRMGRLVSELLDLARIQAGHVELDLKPLPLGPIVHKTLRKFTNLAKEAGISLLEDVQESDQCYQVDEDRMEQILTNLIDNAIRYTPPQGTVTVQLKEDAHGAHISVKDTGDGIPEEDLPFVFERFYKADKARTRGKSGTGLGLAIVKDLVEAHHGHIDVHSKVGEGTTFTIHLPRDLSGERVAR
ncbi:sensor histidine kinase ResE [Caldalkalibacillus thermarum]|nr:sensor histidine kinase ResE [Caldalkalibacillus thermarum]